MTSSRRLHKNDKLWGAVAEALVAAYALIGANGKLTSYRPFTDVDGKDIVIDLAGGFKDIYLQVKCPRDQSKSPDCRHRAPPPRPCPIESEVRLCLLSARSTQDGVDPHLGVPSCIFY